MFLAIQESQVVAQVPPRSQRPTYLRGHLAGAPENRETGEITVRKVPYGLPCTLYWLPQGTAGPWSQWEVSAELRKRKLGI